jgi:hypothetical protein
MSRLEQADRLDLYAVKIAVSPAIYICTGNEPFVHPTTSDVYWPRQMRLERSIAAANPARVIWPLEVDALPKEGEEFGPFADSLANNTLQGATVTVEQFVWLDGWGTTPVSSTTWYVDRAPGAPGRGGDHVAVRLNLSAYIGFRPGAGLSRGESKCDLVNGDGVMCFASSACDHTFSTCQDTDAFVGNRWAIEDQEPIVLGGTPIEPGGPATSHPRFWRWVRTGQNPVTAGPCKEAPIATTKPL